MNKEIKKIVSDIKKADTKEIIRVAQALAVAAFLVWIGFVFVF